MRIIRMCVEREDKIPSWNGREQIKATYKKRGQEYLVRLMEEQEHE
jgi:hypothetical protein